MSVAVLGFTVGNLVEEIGYLEAVGVLLDNACNQVVPRLCLHLLGLFSLFLALCLGFSES